MRGLIVGMFFATLATADLPLFERYLVPEGGWSLSMPSGSSCPDKTATCFSNQTGVSEIFDRTGVPGTFDRGQECCPYGTTPRLDCGTYVNIGQPYACCPLGNADCRGDVEDPQRKANESCANTGWALWQIPDGDFNTFCCLPSWYGFWYAALGQDAVGQCQESKDLPEDATPAMQFNNGDGSVDSSGTQVTALPTATKTPAPTCDILHYGWSLQVDDESGCTEGSDYCSYGGSCCPSTLNCGTVIGDSEVPVCCPADNPDCRGDVEGLWPQVCADSSWALWHVNTNGNHFCCLPGQIGYNIPNDNTAVGFCGSAVPNGTMRSILDYEGDGSTAGSYASFPCDSFPAPNATWPNITSSILNPAPTLNLGVVSLASDYIYPSNSATKTIVKPWKETVYVCPSGATETVALIHSLSNGIPVTATSTVGASGFSATPIVINAIYITYVNGEAPTLTSTSTPSSSAVETIASGSDGSSYPVVEESSSTITSASYFGAEASLSAIAMTTSATRNWSTGGVTGISGTGGYVGTISSISFTGSASSLGGSIAAVALEAIVAAVLLC